MFKYPLYYCVFLVFYNLLALVISVSPEASETIKPLTLVKRNENDLQTCLNNFDIHTDKIIRTQDSKAMGAKFLNERDVASREDCLRMCCETENCDVFVFEEKSPGSCYLFECGSPEDFKCKFTKHKNYTSAVLAVNRHLTELETQIKFTQHEHELTKLREPAQERNQALPPVAKTTTEAPVNKETLQLIPAEVNQEMRNHKCSRYQFTCHSSGECIAIYNACDGIPQCSDGSDEAPELGCPGQTSTTLPPKPVAVTVSPPVSSLKQGRHENEGSGNVNYNPMMQQQYQSNPESPQMQWVQQQQYLRKHPEGENVQAANIFPGNSQQVLNQGAMSQNARANYGREGEGMAYQGEQPWPYQYHSNTGVSQIFTHKGNGLVQQAERYPHPYPPVDPAGGGNGVQYNDRAQSDFMKYNYVDNIPYRVYAQNPQMNGNWEMIHKTHESQAGNAVEDISNGNSERVHSGNMAPQDYYYEDFYRRGQQAPMQRFPLQHTIPQAPVQNNEVTHRETQKSGDLEKEREQNNGGGNVAKSVPSNKSETVTSHPESPSTNAPKVAQHGHIHSSHRKMEKLTAEVTLKETTFLDSELDGHNSSPSGAILSLTFGLCITGIMIVLVGCRMRMVHRRMRRGGKSPYAHDADFLVNGMYL